MASHNTEQPHENIAGRGVTTSLIAQPPGFGGGIATMATENPRRQRPRRRQQQQRKSRELKGQLQQQRALKAAPSGLCLRISQHPPGVWYKDFGGKKTNLMKMDVELKGASQCLHKDARFALRLDLYHENGQRLKEKHQELLSTQLGAPAGGGCLGPVVLSVDEATARVYFRIESVSMRHQGQRFKVRVRALPIDTWTEAYIAGSHGGETLRAPAVWEAFSTPILVKSKKPLALQKQEAAAAAAAEQAAAEAAVRGCGGGGGGRGEHGVERRSSRSRSPRKRRRGGSFGEDDQGSAAATAGAAGAGRQGAARRGSGKQSHEGLPDLSLAGSFHGAAGVSEDVALGIGAMDLVAHVEGGCAKGGNVSNSRGGPGAAASGGKQGNSGGAIKGVLKDLAKTQNQLAETQRALGAMVGVLQECVDYRLNNSGGRGRGP